MKDSNIRGPCGIHSNVNGRGDGTARHLILLVYISVATEIGHVAIPSGSFVHFSIQRGPTLGGGDVASWAGSSGNQRKRLSGRPRLKGGHRGARLDKPTVKILAKNYRGGGSHMLNVMHLMRLELEAVKSTSPIFLFLPVPGLSRSGLISWRPG